MTQPLPDAAARRPIPVRQTAPRALAASLRPTALAVHLTCAAMAGGLWAYAPVAQAQTAGSTATVNADVPAGPLADALNRFALQAGVVIAVDADRLKGKTTPGLKASVPVDEGFRRLLEGSGYQLGRTPAGYVLVAAPVPAPAAANPTTAANAAGEATLPAVRVTASTEPLPGELPKPYAGGQVARGARVGLLGNGDFMETPFNTVAFTEEFRDNIQAQNVADALQYAVSVQSREPGAAARNDSLLLRGFSSPTVLASFDGLTGLLWRVPPVEPFERFELLLGASAFANGRPAVVGGSINLVPKRASDTPLTRVGVNYESDSVFGTSVDIGRRFGANNEWGIRLNGAYADGTTAVEGTDKQKALASLALDYRGERMRASLDAFRSHRDQRSDDLIRIAAGVPLPSVPDASRLYSLRGTRYEHEVDLAVGRLEWDLAPNWTLSTAYGRSNVRKERQRSSSVTLADAAGTLTYTAGESTFAAENDSMEALVRGRFATGPVTHRVSLGATRYTFDFFRGFGPGVTPAPGTLSQPNTSAYPPVTPAVLPPNKTSDEITTGLFISDEIGLFNDRLLITLGARDVKLESNSFNGATGARTGGYKGDAITPAYGVLLKLMPTLSLYANRVEALENGVLVNTTPPATNQGAVLPPLKSKQTEIGFKADLGKFAFTGALFQIDKGNQYLDAASNTFVQNGRQQNRGLELSVFGEPAKGLRLYSGLSVLDAKVKRSAGGTLDGKTPEAVPGYTFTTTLDWDVPGVPGLALLGAVIRVDDTWLDQQNTRKVPAWTRFDAGVRYRTRVAGQATTLRFNVENLADRNYFVAPGFDSVYVAPPRTFLLSATVDF